MISRMIQFDQWRLPPRARPFARFLFAELTQESSLFNLPRVYSITLCSTYEHSGQQPTCGSGNSPLKLRRRDCHQHGDAFWLIFSHCLILMPQLTSENWIICSAHHNWLFSAFGAVFFTPTWLSSSILTTVYAVWLSEPWLFSSLTEFRRGLLVHRTSSSALITVYARHRAPPRLVHWTMEQFVLHRWRFYHLAWIDIVIRVDCLTFLWNLFTRHARNCIS